MSSSASEWARAQKATAKASVFQRGAVSRFMTTPCRMSHRLSVVTKKMALARLPPNALRTNSLGVIGWCGNKAWDWTLWAGGEAKRQMRESVRVHMQEWETKEQARGKKGGEQEKDMGGGSDSQRQREKKKSVNIKQQM